MFKLNEKKKNVQLIGGTIKHMDEKKNIRAGGTRLSSQHIKPRYILFFFMQVILFLFVRSYFFVSDFVVPQVENVFFLSFSRFQYFPLNCFRHRRLLYTVAFWFVIILEQLQQGIRRIKTRHLDFFTINK